MRLSDSCTVRISSLLNGFSGLLGHNAATNTEKRTERKNNQGESPRVNEGKDETNDELGYELHGGPKLATDTGLNDVDVTGDAGNEFTSGLTIVPRLVLFHERMEVELANSNRGSGRDSYEEVHLNEGADKGDRTEDEWPLCYIADGCGRGFLGPKAQQCTVA